MSPQIGLADEIRVCCVAGIFSCEAHHYNLINKIEQDAN